MKHGKTPYTSTFYMWNGVAAVFYSSYLTPFHSHNTLQLVLDTQSNFRVRLKDSGWNTYKNLIIRENVIHQLDTNNSVQLIVYLDADLKISQAIRSRYLIEREVCSPEFNIFHLINSNELELALLKRDPSLLESLVHRILVRLSGKMEMAPAEDERVLFVEQAISTGHPVEITIESLARKLFLSESRLRSLFRDGTGIPLYHYILWNKIRFATNQIMAGYTVNEAALEAGFTDSSHFHKTMMKMFGISPSQFLKDNTRRHSQICDESPLHFETSVYNMRLWMVERVVHKP